MRTVTRILTRILINKGSAPFAMLLAFFSCSLAPFAFADSVTSNSDCSIYRRGSLTEQTIFKFDAPKVRSPITAYYRQEYVFQPEMRGAENGMPDSDILFEIDIQSGQPIDLRAVLAKRPKDYVHLRLLVQGDTWRPVASRLPIIAGRLNQMPRMTTAEGIQTLDPSGFEDLNEDFHGFRKVRYAKSDRNDQEEFFIGRNESGEIGEILRCSRIDFVVNPGCSLYGRTKFFEFSAGFNRSQMPNIALIRSHAEKFTSCLTTRE